MFDSKAFLSVIDNVIVVTIYLWITLSCIFIATSQSVLMYNNSPFMDHRLGSGALGQSGLLPKTPFSFSFPRRGCLWKRQQV